MSMNEFINNKKIFISNKEIIIFKIQDIIDRTDEIIASMSAAGVSNDSIKILMNARDQLHFILMNAREQLHFEKSKDENELKKMEALKG